MDWEFWNGNALVVIGFLLIVGSYTIRSLPEGTRWLGRIIGFLVLLLGAYVMFFRGDGA